MDFVTVDALGRILLPKPLRDELRLKPGTRMLAVPSKGALLLKEWDLDALARAMFEDLEGVDIDRLAKEIRAEANLDARRRYGDVLDRHERAGGRHQASAPPDVHARPAGLGRKRRSHHARSKS